jgi:hypothetical protein
MQSVVCRYFFIRKIKRILKPEKIDSNHWVKVIFRPSAFRTSAQSLDAGSMSASSAAVSSRSWDSVCVADCCGTAA